MPYLDDSAKKRIEEEIAKVEARTAGELVVVTVPASDGYHDVRALYAAAFALCTAAVVHVALPLLSVTFLLWLELVAGAAAWLTLGTPPLLRLFLPRGRIEQSVQARAKQEFLEHELFATRDRSGVLILISELEHRVVILGDAGVHSRLPEGAWEKHVARIAAGFREGHPLVELCEVIDELGQLLIAHFPRREGDENELENRVRSGD